MKAVRFAPDSILMFRYEPTMQCDRFLCCYLIMCLCVVICWFQVQTWTVVKEKDCEDSSCGKMYGEWVDHVNGVILIAYCETCELMLT